MQLIRQIALIVALSFPAAALAHGGGEHVMGTVKAVDANGVTVETTEGKEVKVVFDAGTKIEKNGAPSSASELSAGQRVVVHTMKKQGAGDPVAVLVKLAGAQTVSVSVTDEGFVPDRATVKKGQPVDLIVTRKTDRTCATSITIPDFGIKRELPLNEPVTLSFTPTKAGEIKYSCGMGMLSGVLVVE